MSLIAPDILELQGLPVTVYSKRHFDRMTAWHMDPLLKIMHVAGDFDDIKFDYKMPTLTSNIGDLDTQLMAKLVEKHGLSRSLFPEMVSTKDGLEPYTPE